MSRRFLECTVSSRQEQWAASQLQVRSVPEEEEEEEDEKEHDEDEDEDDQDGYSE
jgi:hypothetical protein